MKIFISHSSKNADAAQEVCALVEKDGHKCFLAPRDIRSGYVYAEEIINGIDSSDVLLLLLSSAANESPHVLREIERAVSKNINIVVYKLEEVTLSRSMEYFLMTHQWLHSRPDEGFGVIRDCMNALAEKQGEDAVHITSEKPAAPVQAAPKTNKKLIAAVAAAAVLLCAAGIFIGVMLGKGGDTVSTGGSGASEPVAAATSDASATTTTPTTVTTTTTSTTTNTTAATTTTTAATSSTVTEQSTSDTTDVQTSTSLQQTTTQTTVSSDESSTQEAVILAELGDRLTFGSYNGEAIEWRVIALSDDGRCATVISDRILTMKAYDAAEGGKFNTSDGESYWNVPDTELDTELQRTIRGDNRWELSNIRTWLNSEKETVTYENGEPNAKAMSEQKNGYNTEPGFLNSFTRAERAAIIPVEITTNGAITTDRVYLLSLEELSLLADADVSRFAKPTDAAVAQDGSRWYELYFNDYGTTDHYWWLRDGAEDSACECYAIGNSYVGSDPISDPAGLEGYGIRPVMNIDLTAID